MPNYRRAHVPGGSFFFTLVCERRVPLFADARARRLLGSVLRRAQWRWPFTINALVLLPEHLHTIWSLPSGDAAYPARWGWIKKEFTKAWLTPGGVEQEVSRGGKRERRRGIWQRRFWEHTLESEDDFERHFDYIHSNPVKHKHVRCPRDWPWSSFHRWVQAGVYPPDWACGDRPPPDFQVLEDSTGEPAGCDGGPATGGIR
jgi:putative transposase